MTAQIVDPQIKAEIELSEARKIAKDMGHIRECLDGQKDAEFAGVHSINCPYWESVKNTEIAQRKGVK